MNGWCDVDHGEIPCPIVFLKNIAPVLIVVAMLTAYWGLSVPRNLHVAKLTVKRELPKYEITFKISNLPLYHARITGQPIFSI